MKKGFAVGFAICLVLLIVAALLYQEAHAVSKSDIDDSRKRITQSEQKIKDLTNKISEKRIQVLNIEKEVRNNQETLKETRQLAFQSWEYIPEVERLEKVQDNLNKNLKTTKTELEKLISEKNHAESNHRKLLDRLEEIELIYIKENKANLKGLKAVIGIRISDACITTLQNNVTNPCGVNYRDLLQFDSSDRSKSGRFTTDDNGFFHRGKPQYENDCRFYDDLKHPIIIVDPSSYCLTRIPMIEIRPNFDTYFLREGLTQSEKFEMVDVKINQTFSKKVKTIQVRNQTQDFGLVVYHDRYVEKCRLAYINADNLQLLLADTIHYLRSGCTPQSTSFNEKEIIYQNSTSFDISTSKDFQLKEWIKHVKAFCIFKYRSCTE